MERLQKSCTYLENQGVTLFGLKIWGCPTTLQFRSVAHAFQKESEEMLCQEWESLPSDTDLLITHSPPFKILDKTKRGMNGGSPSLAAQVSSRIKPILHQFGHIHEAYGVVQVDDTLCVNAASCDEHYESGRGPIHLKIPLQPKDCSEVIISL